jgi:hypothetical protein
MTFMLNVGQPATAERLDGWSNVFTGMGQRGRDKSASTTFQGATDLDVFYLERIYRGDAIAAKIVDLPANEMTRAWIEFKHGDDPEAAKAILKALADMGAQKSVREGLKWARLLGGAAIVFAVDDGRPQDQPVNLDAIQSVEIVSVLDRWQIFPETYYEDPFDAANAAKYGKPMLYRMVPISLVASTRQMDSLIHETRIIRFDGVQLPPRERLRNWGWGDSVLNRVYEVVRDYNGAHGAIPTIIQEFVINVYKLKNLAAMISQGGQAGADTVINRLEMMKLAQGAFRMNLLDADAESIERTSLTVSGLGDLVDRVERRLVAATDIPHNILLGEAPGSHKASLNAGNGQGEKRDWFDTVKAKQEDELRGPLAYLLELLMRSRKGPTGGKLPKTWSFAFVPLWQQDAKQEADTRLVQAQADQIYLDRGVLSPGEVAMSRFGGDGYSTDTVLDMKARNELGELEEEDEEHEPADPPPPARPDDEPADEEEGE